MKRNAQSKILNKEARVNFTIMKSMKNCVEVAACPPYLLPTKPKSLPQAFECLSECVMNKNIICLERHIISRWNCC